MNALSAIPAIVETGKELYNLYQSYSNSGNNKLGVKAKEMRLIGHYNKNGKKLGIYHK